ncbi:hypothetical protein HPC49_21310 [Pyxidicoccus fallax]|uniref:Uncharacterized protein n=1 Tax=Pyxidicoccus fallax TaxID=394095 RepID=A0A848LQ46_9BACT|nr:hypothetical protein [Pyxidicoccus fallax]NMO20018.1 hypothetical protein [Pyxidicoccus fallax]NPC80752.1 hypothetical protein [Pyxidicoccus fallax]
MVRRVLEAKLRTGWCVVGLGLGVGMAGSAVAAPAPGPKERAELLRVHGGWADRARALSAVARPDRATLRGHRARCWGIGEALPSVLAADIDSNQQALDASFNRLKELLALPAATGAPLLREDPAVAQQRAELLKTLDALERRQLMLETEVLQPRPVSSALVSEVISNISNRARRKDCREWMKGWNAELVEAAKFRPPEDSLAAQVDERIRWDFLDRAADGEVFNANNAGLPSALTEEAGMTERLGGPDSLAVSLAWALGSMEETAGLRGIFTFNPTFTLRERPPPDSREEKRTPFIRLELPVTTTLTDDPPPAEGEPQGRLRRYALVLGYDLRDFRDPRRWKRLECLEGVEALVPLLGLPTQASITSLATRRRPFYARCVEEGANALRMGFRGSAQLLTVDAPAGDAVRAGPVALAFIMEPNRHFAGQFTWRQVNWPRFHHEFVLSAHLGTGLPRPAFGTDSLVRLGLDASLTFSDRRSEEHRAQWLVAPSLLVRVTPYVFATVSMGYLRGFSESGMMTNLALTLDADPALTYRVPPPSL